MFSKTIQKYNLLERFVALLAVVLVIGLIATQAQTEPNNIFNLRFNGFALISFTAVCINITFIVIALRKRRQFKSAEFTWYFLFLCTLVLFGTFEMLQRL